VNVLLVSAHPLADSYTAAVRAAAVRGLETAGHVVDVADLDAEGFDPCSRDASDVQAHTARLERADALILVYPTWWGAQPAILWGWLDRFWTDGAAFSQRPGARRARPGLRNLRHLVAITTHGSPKWINAVEGEPGKRVVLRRMRSCCHPRVRTRWIALYGMDRSDDAERRAFLQRVERSMGALQPEP
jgi:NAD(P)H dehydrogenase (quinone)